MGTYRLTVIETFAAAHHLPNHPGACRRLHGHTWRIEVTWQFAADALDETTGLAVDFLVLKERLRTILPDHCDLNERYGFIPTAENLARHFSEALQGATIRLWESETAHVTYTP